MTDNHLNITHLNNRHLNNRHTRVVLAAGAALVMAALACSDSTGTNDLADSGAPSIKLAANGATAIDSLLAFSVDVKDNLGIKRVHIDATGGVKASFDSVFTSAVTRTSLALSLAVPHGVPGGTAVMIVGTVFNGAGNKSAPTHSGLRRATLHRTLFG